mmetsp:Transcript_12313/g.17116  ORF Transcript_12313/g.17116 Transcript_12313/m.17116 type:complete len:459 (-) Transcript_12313:85-1461(-)|eukprot:CAMPEP_0184488592 /NCGR_PEP_ID=MMETSP0113_2-20130426/12577_1 /TAXON_ID=91329 /ORGANISM="Norrisiella sphaerica, Strain BC52" /LENGTH=458 /DNA_ID=CAMNT_0026871475 /DNA_START=89 /DNA_END=1465 /DNA_ORIENTATION=-
MKATQCQEMFPSIDLDVIQAVIDQYRGNQEKILAALLEMTPKDTMTINRVKRKLKLFQTKHWQVITARGLNIRATPSMSIATPVTGILQSGEYVEELETRETKAGKLWVRHSRGWSLATRKGEVGMKRVKNPYSHVDLDRVLKSGQESEKTKQRKKKNKEKKKAKAPVSEKAGRSSGFDNFGGGGDPFDEDPFLKAAGVAKKPTSQLKVKPKKSRTRNRKAAGATPGTTKEIISGFDQGTTEAVTLEDIFQNKANLNGTSGGRESIESVFNDVNGFNNDQNPNLLDDGEEEKNDILAQVMTTGKNDKGMETPQATEGMKDPWATNLLNLEDVTKEAPKKSKYKPSLNEIKGETIEVGNNFRPSKYGPPPAMTLQSPSTKIFFSKNQDPFTYRPTSKHNQALTLMPAGPPQGVYTGPQYGYPAQQPMHGYPQQNYGHAVPGGPNPFYAHQSQNPFQQRR